MNKQFKNFLKKCFWFVIFLFCIRCFIINKTPFSSLTLYDLFGFSGEAISVTTLIMFWYEKHLWKYLCLEEVPILKERYVGSFISTYDKVERVAKLHVKQTLLTVSIVFETNESKSESILASVEQIQNEWQLTYCYLNIPQANVRERSAIHYGTAMICIEDPKSLRGQYYTDRKTTGDLFFRPDL